MMVDSDNIIGFDLVGKVKRLRFYKTQVLLPLFEAVVNSIHSIQRMKINNGIIDISFNRDNSQGVLFQDGINTNPIKEFRHGKTLKSFLFFYLLVIYICLFNIL